MACTAARRQRRLEEQQVKLKNRSTEIIITQMKDLYKEDPNKALDFCFCVVGRERFQNSLKWYLTKHLADVAFMLALKYCLRFDTKNLKGE